ncbi:MAG TPA: MFS transporter [Xanthobacteraceae bacterium]|nr:MFS transporter [Xanthobacteraceae bacterium]
MTQAVSAPIRRFSEIRVVAPICAAHFVSHYYMIMLAPLFAFVRADYGISYTGLALALTAFNVVSAALQTPVGFLVDRIGPRIVLISGVALGAVAFAIAGLVHSFVVFIAMYAVAGLGNTAYHPADYSLLSRTPPGRIGQVFSFHTFSGILGGAVAPVTLLAMQSHFGWRGAYVGAALLGLIVLIPLLMQRPAPSDRISEKRRSTAPTNDAGGAQTSEAGLKLLLSAPILLNLLYFILTSVMGGLNSFLVVALAALYGTPDTLANGALTALLLMSALGVLVGGALAVRTKRHATVAALGLACAGVSTALVGFAGGSAFGLIILTSVSGFSVGITSPSRDMLVRAVTPPGAFGRVFGFVSSGFNIGAMIAPTVYGMMMDHGVPRGLFLFSAACSILCIGTVIFSFAGREQR